MKNYLYILILGIAFTSCKKEVVRETTIVRNESNVFTSTIYSTSWTVSGQFQTARILNPAITQDIVDNGAVLVYQKESDWWITLPHTYYGNPSYSTTIRVNHAVGYFDVWRSRSDLAVPTNPGNQTYRCVVISGEQLSQNPNIDVNNLDQMIELANKVQK